MYDLPKCKTCHKLIDFTGSSLNDPCLCPKYPKEEKLFKPEDIKVRQLLDFSSAELEAEVERRKNVKPTQLPYFINFDNVVQYVKNNINAISDGERLDKDFEHYLFEMVMETIYGHEIWKWWNNKVQ